LEKKKSYIIFMGPKRKREEIKEKSDQLVDLDEAIEEGLNIDDEDKSVSSEGEGEDLMEDLER
jgi:hypothetical protein